MLTRFFARRYLFSPKSRSVINVIAGVSVLSFAMPVAAMIVLLSVLNGFGDFAKSMSSAFDADLTVAPREGQTFASAEIDSLALTRVKGVGVVSYLLEQQVLLERDGLQTMATLRGVDDRYTEVFPIEETIPLGSWSVRTGDLDRLVLGRDMARTLGIRSLVRAEVAVYALRRGSFSSLLPVDGYSVRRLDVGGLFFLDLESENEYALTSLRAAQELFDRPGRISAISVRVADGADAEKVRREIAGIVGDDFTVRTRDEMNALFFRLVAYEKWGVFFISLLVLVLASFSVVGTLVMLMIEKPVDPAILDHVNRTEQAVAAGLSELYAQGLQSGQALRNIVLDPANQVAYDNLKASHQAFDEAYEATLAVVRGTPVEAALLPLKQLRVTQVGVQGQVRDLARSDPAAAAQALNSLETPAWRAD